MDDVIINVNVSDISMPIDPELVLDELDNCKIVAYLGVNEILAEITELQVTCYYGNGDLLDYINDSVIVSEVGTGNLLESMNIEDIKGWLADNE